jgi:hypothetical protein
VYEKILKKERKRRKDLPLHTLENTAKIYMRFMLCGWFLTGSLFKKKNKMGIKLVYTLIRVNVHTYSELSLGVYTHVRPIRICAVSIFGTRESARYLAFVNIWHVTQLVSNTYEKEEGGRIKEIK